MQKKVVKIDLTTNQEYIVEDGWTISKYLDVSAHYLIVVLEKDQEYYYQNPGLTPAYAGQDVVTERPTVTARLDGGGTNIGLAGNTVMFDPYSTTTTGRTR